MPLSKGTGKEAFSKNVETEMAAGKPQKQAVAIAYSKQRKNRMNKDTAKQAMNLIHALDKALDAWNESSHKRAANGQFGSGGGSGNSAANTGKQPDHSYVSPTKEHKKAIESMFTKNYQKAQNSSGEGNAWHRAVSMTVSQLRKANPELKEEHAYRQVKETVSDE